MHTHAHACTYTQYRQLESSLTKQASDWVKLREKETKTEKTVKWSQVSCFIHMYNTIMFLSLIYHAMAS